MLPPLSTPAAPAHDAGDHPEDVDDDGFTDLISHYRRGEIGLSARDRDACVTGETLGSIPLRGCDAIRIVGPRCGLGYELSFALAAGLWRRARRRERSLMGARSSRSGCARVVLP